MKVPFEGRSRVARNRWLVGAVLLLAVVVVGALVSGRTSRNNAGNSRSASSMSDMTNMPGMDMNQAGAVTLTAGQLSQFGVTFDTAKMRTLTTEVRAAGIVQLDETRLFQVTPKFAGYVDRLDVNATGQPVSRGQSVAAIFSPELVAAQTELLLAARLDRTVGQSSVPGAQPDGPSLLSAARQRLRLWDISENQIDGILRSGQVRRTLTLFSPASGIVVEKNVVQGQSVTAGMQLMTIANLSTIWVTAELRESDAGSVRSGSQAVVELAAFPGEKLSGRVSYVYPTLQPESRTIRARIVLLNPGTRIKPGMYATVRLTTPTVTALTVPSAAVIQTGDRSYVFVRQSGGSLMPRDVRLGRRGGSFTEIVSGVRQGQEVVTSAQFLLDSESNLGDVMRSMIGQGAGMDKGADMKGMNMPSATRK